MHLPSPSENFLKELNRLFHAKRDAMPVIHWNNVYFRRYRDYLFVHTEIATDASRPRNGKTIVSFRGDRRATWESQPNHRVIAKKTSPHHSSKTLTQDEIDWCKKNLPYKLSDPNISITFRQGGERFIPAGKKQSRPLKKLFQEWKIPPWQRDQIPLIYYNNKIIAIVGFDKGNANATFND